MPDFASQDYKVLDEYFKISRQPTALNTTMHDSATTQPVIGEFNTVSGYASYVNMCACIRQQAKSAFRKLTNPEDADAFLAQFEPMFDDYLATKPGILSSFEQPVT